jgi:hypothetical protein
VIVAASGAQRALLQAEFASLTFVDLPGYSVKYGKNRAITILRLIASIPKILIRIKQERAWLKGFVSREEPDLVISDNRYGLAVPGVFCVFITHQLMIRTSFGRWADRLLQRIYYRWIDRFSRCWVPDFRGPDSLAGELSGPRRMPRITTRYLGILSRLQAKVEDRVIAGTPVPTERPTEDSTKASPVLVILSGPEPQRTLLERQILRQSPAAGCPIVLIRGLPGGGKPLEQVPAAVTVYDHLPSANLGRLMAEARLVIARSGYSTVMDLARMRKRAVLIPTPGQTEQEYLGEYIAAKGWAACVRQDKFSLEAALRPAAPGRPGSQETSWAGSGREGTMAVWPEVDHGELLRTEVLAVLAQSCPALG